MRRYKIIFIPTRMFTENSTKAIRLRYASSLLPIPSMGVFRCLPRVTQGIPMGVCKASLRPLGIISKTLGNYLHAPWKRHLRPLEAAASTVRGGTFDRWKPLKISCTLLFEVIIVSLLPNCLGLLQGCSTIVAGQIPIVLQAPPFIYRHFSHIIAGIAGFFVFVLPVALLTAERERKGGGQPPYEQRAQTCRP